MKKSIYEKLEDIPQIDKDENNYSLCTDSGSPNNGKYVLILDGAHPVQISKATILNEKNTAAQQHQTAIQQKDAEITNLNTQLQAAKNQPLTLPAGQVAVPAEKLTVLNQFESLGKFEEIKAKVEEHGTLKEQTEATARKELYADVAKVHGFEPEAFSALAEQNNLHERLEKREVPDVKKPAEKVTHYFVKGKDANGADTSQVIGEFVKADASFKPFLLALSAQSGGGTGKTRRVPDMGVGEVPETPAAGKSYINSRYKLPAKQKEEV